MLSRSKWFLLAIAVAAICAGAYGGLQQFLILPGFAILEREEAETDLARCRDAILREIDALRNLTTDWASRVDTSDFAREPDDAFIELNGGWDHFERRLGLNLLYISNRSGEVVYGRIRDSARGGDLVLERFPTEAFAPDDPLISFASPEDFRAGVIPTELGPMIISAHPIFRAHGEGPASGTIMMGRFLSDAVVARLSTQARVQFRVHGRSDTDPSFEACVAMEEVDDEILRTSGRFSGLDGEPALLIVAERHRNIMAQGRTTARFVSFAVMAAFAALIAVLSLWFALHVRESRRHAAEVRKLHSSVRDGEENFRAFFNTIDDFLAVVDEDGRILRLNRASIDALGFSERRLAGRMLALGSDADGRKAVGDLIDEAVLRGTATGQLTMRSREGLRMPIESKLNRGRWNGVPALFGVSRDITNRVRAEQENIRLEAQLQQVQKMEAIGTLAGGVAHDFNNILFSAIGFTEMAGKAVPAESRAAECLDHVMIGLRRAGDLVRQILTFSRQSEVERKPIRLQLIIQEAIHLLRGSIPSTIEIHESISETCGPVMAEPTRIHQVVMNLCTNAYHAMREDGGKLTVGLEARAVGNELSLTDIDLAPGVYACLSVADTGHGMDEKVSKRIFDPYFTTKDVGDGTGLGLATVHGIVKSHDGALHVQSEEGKGTTVLVLLPLWVEPAMSRDEPEDAGGEIRGSERVLFADDEDQIRKFVRLALGDLGYDVRTFPGGIEALEAFRDAPDEFDIVVTDQTMPGLTGGNLAVEVLAIRPAMPVIICSGFSDVLSAERALELGACDYITKPISTRDLALAIRRGLDRVPIVEV
jgi:PAS domain S-box-containing protein